MMKLSNKTNKYIEEIKMDIKIHNVAKILEAEVTLKGLTVIAGYNNMGKSTILKAIYIVLNTFRDVNHKILNARRNSISSYILNQESYFDSKGYETLPRDLLYSLTDNINRRLRDFMNGKDNYELFKKIFSESLEEYKEFWSNEVEDCNIHLEELTRPLYERIKEICLRDKDEDLKYIIDMYIRNLFNGQLNSLHNISDAYIEINSLNEFCCLSIKKNKVVDIKYAMNTEASVFYLPAYNMLDRITNRTYGMMVYSPEYDIKSVLNSSEKEPTFEEYQETEDNTKLIKEIFNEVVHGRLVKKSNGISFQDEELNNSVSINNVASGMKNFLIIQSLVEKGKLKRDSILLIDEPEANLHPEWHLKFAEILVLMYKNMGVRSIVNSHSPYFIRALEVKMADYKIKDHGKYYLMREDAGNLFKVQDVTDETDKIYELLYRPLEYL